MIAGSFGRYSVETTRDHELRRGEVAADVVTDPLRRGQIPMPLSSF
jgi:hypothetical protein